MAIKVQYPGVAGSVDCDIDNLRTILRIGVLPPGMFVDNVLQELRKELKEECDYVKEAEKQERYRGLLQQHTELASFFHVPAVFREYCTPQMLITEYVRGVPVDHLAGSDVPQDYRNYVAEKMLSLTLHELFLWRFMQTDPNYANFLFDAPQQRMHLLDFGATREFQAAFVHDYLEVVAAAAREDRATIVQKSIALGFLTGREVREMVDAHVTSVLLLGKPFRSPHGEPFDFERDNIPGSVQRLVPTMVKLRLKPPPTPAYSLHRRLSGTILLATKLKAKIDSGKIFWDIYEKCRHVSK